MRMRALLFEIQDVVNVADSGKFFKKKSLWIFAESTLADRL